MRKSWHFVALQCYSRSLRATVETLCMETGTIPTATLHRRGSWSFMEPWTLLLTSGSKAHGKSTIIGVDSSAIGMQVHTRPIHIPCRLPSYEMEKSFRRDFRSME